MTITPHAISLPLMPCRHTAAKIDGFYDTLSVCCAAADGDAVPMPHNTRSMAAKSIRHCFTSRHHAASYCLTRLRRHVAAMRHMHSAVAARWRDTP